MAKEIKNKPVPIEIEQASISTYEIASKIETLFMFAFELIPDIDLLKKYSNKVLEKVNTVDSVAAILGTEYELKKAEWGMRGKRITALINLLEILKETDDDLKNAKNYSVKIASISKQLGL